MLNNEKINLFLFGACDLHDILDDDIIFRDFNVMKNLNELAESDKFTLDFNKMSFPENGTSLISLYSKPGPIAQRVLETLVKSRHRDIVVNRPIYKEIVKYPYLDYYRKHAGPKDYLVMGFSAELYTKFINNAECFSCLPVMHILSNPDNCLHWIYKDYFTKDHFLLPFDTKESLEWSFDILVDFARDIYSIFQDRVILVKTHFSNFAVSNNFTVKKVDVGPDNLLFYKQSKIATDPTDYKYAERLSNIIMSKFQHHYSSDLPLIKLDEPVFLDANHRWGMSQFHIDKNSRHKIAKLIREEIIKRSVLQFNE